MAHMTERDYQAQAIKTRDEELAERNESLAHIVEELKRLALVEYEHNIAPRGCSPSTALREAREFTKRVTDALFDEVTGNTTAFYLDDPRRR